MNLAITRPLFLVSTTIQLIMFFSTIWGGVYTRGWVIPEKIYNTLPIQRRFLSSGRGGGGGGGRGTENLLLIIVKCATGHAKGVGGGGLTSNFCGGADVL